MDDSQNKFQGEQCAHPETTQAVEDDPARFQVLMNTLRMRRKLFFGVVIIYMPLMWLVHRISPTFRSMAIAFAVWVMLLFFSALYSALARCPRCGKTFHLNGMSLLYFRRCLHCDLHLSSKNKDGNF